MRGSVDDAVLRVGRREQSEAKFEYFGAGIASVGDPLVCVCVCVCVALVKVSAQF